MPEVNYDYENAKTSNNMIWIIIIGVLISALMYSLYEIDQLKKENALLHTQKDGEKARHKEIALKQGEELRNARERLKVITEETGKLENELKKEKERANLEKRMRTTHLAHIKELKRELEFSKKNNKKRSDENNTLKKEESDAKMNLKEKEAELEMAKREIEKLEKSLKEAEQKSLIR